MMIKEIEKLVDTTLETRGFKRDFPVRLNNRFSRTYGAVRLRDRKIYAMEFNSNFVAQAPDELMRETVLHECAHVIVDLRYPNEFHNHDDVLMRHAQNSALMVARQPILQLNVNIMCIVRIVVLSLLMTERQKWFLM